MPRPVTQAADNLEAARLLAVFEQAGAVRIETDILQPAGTLLDLYGEAIRGRAYITQDPDQGEMMLRPDFTVPIAQMHMAEAAEPARYTYSGPVFRKQDADQRRAREYLQVGFEVFDGSDPAQADAEVFALFADILAPFDVTATIGDIGILIAAVDGLSTTHRRRMALRRHIWRPARFRALLNRFTGAVPPGADRIALLASPEHDAETSSVIGLRTPQEINDRIKALREDAATPPIGAIEADVLNEVIAISAPINAALTRLRDIAVDLTALTPAIDQFETRLEALAAHGVDLDGLHFETAFGRTSMEYYDSFVFGFSARPDWPPIATGGRYDALTEVLGGGTRHPAVGGVIRPSQLRALREAAR